MDIGHYTLIKQVPGGRYGALWKAHDADVGRDVVLKQLASVADDRRPRIRAQAEAASRLQHKNLARTYAPIEDDTSVWLVEEWIDGSSLAAITAAHAELTPRQALGVLHETLEGLAHAHHNGLVHGNVAPRTILIDTDGVPKLVEFGAWVSQPEVAGIGQFASPEAFDGAELGKTADVYSAAAVLAHLLEGQGPDGQTPDSLDGLQSDLAPVLARAMSPDPASRQPNAQVLLDELDRAAEQRFGAAWWTTEGLGAVAASTTSATIAASGAAGGLGAVSGSAAGTSAGGFGAVSGSMSLQGELGAGAIAGARAPSGGLGALAGSAAAARAARRRKIIAIVAGAVAVVAAAVSLFLFLKPRTVEASPEPPTGAQPPAGGQSPAGQSSPSASPTPEPNPAQAFSGVYRYESVVTKSTAAAIPVGQKVTDTWTVQTTCVGTMCKTTAKAATAGSQSLKASPPDGWSTRTASKGACVNVRTGVKTGQMVPTLYTRTLTATKSSGDHVVKMAGKDRFQQTKPCKNQAAALYDVQKKITITYVRE
jgi:Protein kinase domain